MKYTPISCSFYDELEAFATLQQQVTIVYKNDTQASTATNGIITDLFIKDKVEYLQLDSGLTLRLDTLISVGGKSLTEGKYCTI